MKKLASGVIVALVAVVIGTVVLAAKDRKTLIVFTKNYNTAGAIKSECIGVVATETLPAQKRDGVTWKVVNTHGQSNDDDCTGLDNTKVELRFADNVMGSTTLTANAGGIINGTVSESATDGAHKYRVWYKGVAAGPDPEIDIGCAGCGPGGGRGPGPGN